MDWYMAIDILYLLCGIVMYRLGVIEAHGGDGWWLRGANSLLTISQNSTFARSFVESMERGGDVWTQRLLFQGVRREWGRGSGVAACQSSGRGDGGNRIWGQFWERSMHMDCRSELIVAPVDVCWIYVVMVDDAIMAWKYRSTSERWLLSSSSKILS